MRLLFSRRFCTNCANDFAVKRRDKDEIKRPCQRINEVSIVMNRFLFLFLSLILSLSLVSPDAFAKGGGGRGGGNRGGGGRKSSAVHSSSKGSSTHVKGYTKKNGTYVAPHHRTTPDKLKSNNWSTKGNVNPDTGKPGTKDPNK